MNESGKESFGFKSKQHPVYISEVQIFGKDLLAMVKSIQFRNMKNDFQVKIKNNISKIKSSQNVFVSVDKTTNLYEMTPNDYKKLLYKNINKTYKKSKNRLEHAINMEAKHIAKNVKLDCQIEILAKTPAFITLKYHKENFRFSQ